MAVILESREESINQKEATIGSLSTELQFVKTKMEYLEQFFNQFNEQKTMISEKLQGINPMGDDMGKRVDVILNSSTGQ